MVNFFFLDKNPKLNAQYYCDKHVNKIMIEICQLLSNVLHNNTNLKPPYKKTTNIPITLAPYKWANYRRQNSQKTQIVFSTNLMLYYII